MNLSFLALVMFSGFNSEQFRYVYSNQTGMLPLFVPFAQGFAAVITATITGSLYYVATAPKGMHISTFDIPASDRY